MRPSEGSQPVTGRAPLRTLVGCTVVAALLLATPAFAQDVPAGADTALVLPDDHPLRPQPPPRPDIGPLERVFGVLGWVGRRPFEFLGSGAEGTSIWYEEKVGGFAEGLSGSALGGAREPSYVSFTGGPIGTRSGMIGGGVHLHNDSWKTEGLQYGVTAAFTHRLYQEYTAYAGWNKPTEHPYLLITGFYDVDTMDEFWGFGPDSDEKDEASFSWERWGVGAIAGLPEEKRGLRFNVHGGWEKSFVYEGDASDEPDAIDLFADIDLGQIELASAGAALGLDLRDAPGHPTAGVFVSGGADWYTSTDDFDFEWLHWNGQAQAHIPLGSEWHILSFKALAEEADPREDDGEIPFPYQPALGGSQTLRGFDSWRFRDNAAVHGLAAFRWRLWQEHAQDEDKAGVFEATLFYETGNVGPTIDDIETGDLKQAYGFTLSMYLLDSHLMTAGVGYSEEAIRFVFSTRDPW